MTIVKGGLKDASVAVRVASAHALAAICSAVAASAAGICETAAPQLPLTCHIPMPIMWELLGGKNMDDTVCGSVRLNFARSVLDCVAK